MIELLALFGEHLVERFGLCRGAREAIQNKAPLTVGLLDSPRDDLDHDRVGHQPARVHDGLGILAERAARSHRGTQHVARRELHETMLLLEKLGLRAFSGTRRPEQDDVHGDVRSRHQPRRPLSLAFRISPSYWWARRWL